MESLKKMDEFLEKAMDIVTVSLLLMLLVLLLANIFLRMVPICSLRWYNEIVELIFAWFIFIGVAAVWRKKEHSYVEYLPNKIVDTKWELLFKTIIELLSLGFVASFLYYSSLLTIRVTAVSPVLQLSRKLFYIPMVLSGIIMLTYTLKSVLELTISLGGRVKIWKLENRLIQKTQKDMIPKG